MQDNLFNSEHASERKICMNFPKEIIYSAVEGPGLKILSIEKNLSIRFVSIPYAECYLYFPSLFLLLCPVWYIPGSSTCRTLNKISEVLSSFLIRATGLLTIICIVNFSDLHSSSRVKLPGFKSQSCLLAVQSWTNYLNTSVSVFPFIYKMRIIIQMKYFLKFLKSFCERR